MTYNYLISGPTVHTMTYNYLTSGPAVHTMIYNYLISGPAVHTMTYNYLTYVYTTSDYIMAYISLPTWPTYSMHSTPGT